MLFQENQTILFFGDSITECKKTKEEGAYFDNPLGQGFVQLIFGELFTKYPSLNLRILNKGVSGHRSLDLVNRFESDVINEKPDWLIIMVGVNDIWRQYDCPQMPRFFQTDQMYKENVETLCKEAINHDIKVILLSPFMIESRTDEIMRAHIHRYILINKEIAHKYNLHYIDMQSPFDDLLRFVTTHEISRDLIHPNIIGHT